MFNWPAAVLSLIGMTVLGFFWYDKRFFGTPWMKAVGLTEKKIKEGQQNMPMTFGSMFALSFFQILAFQWLAAALNARELPHLLGIAFSLWFAFILASETPHYMFARRPLSLLLIDTGYSLVGLLLTATVLRLLMM